MRMVKNYGTAVLYDGTNIRTDLLFFLERAYPLSFFGHDGVLAAQSSSCI